MHLLYSFQQNLKTEEKSSNSFLQKVDILYEMHLAFRAGYWYAELEIWESFPGDFPLYVFLSSWRGCGTALWNMPVSMLAFVPEYV